MTTRIPKTWYSCEISIKCRIFILTIIYIFYIYTYLYIYILNAHVYIMRMLVSSNVLETHSSFCSSVSLNIYNNNKSSNNNNKISIQLYLLQCACVCVATKNIKRLTYENTRIYIGSRYEVNYISLQPRAHAHIIILSRTFYI